MKQYSAFILIGLISSMIFFAQGNAQTRWVRYQVDPVLDLGAPGQWDDAWISYPFVIHSGTQFIMYYTGFPTVSVSGAQIGRANSSDGIYWTREEENPLVTTGSAGEWDDASVLSGPVILDVSIYKMWFTGFDGTRYRGGLATSSDGITWAKYGGNPVFELGASGQWDDRHVAVCSVILSESIYKMWYVGAESSTGLWRVGYATSTNGISWQRYAQNPVLDIGDPGRWDDDSIYNCYVQYNDNIYQMWYWGDDGSIGRTGYATSPDGVTWTRFAQNPVLAPEESWENLVTAIGSVCMDSTDYFMWYMGQSASAGRIGLATIIDNIKVFQFKVPLQFELFQNYPNPFNPSTKIKFSLPEPEIVKIEIYNIMAQKVETLIDESVRPGTHVVEFNAFSFPSGIYYCRIQAGNFQDVKKMVLIR